MTLRWVPTGAFEINGSDLTFKGRVFERDVSGDIRREALIGTATSNQIFYGGTVSIDVQFTPQPADIAEPLPTYLAEIVVWKDLVTGNMVTAGLGGNFYLFSARIWDGKSRKWSSTLLADGSIDQLNVKEPHNIAATVQSSNLSLAIDGVHLGSADAPFPIVGSQIGVLCSSYSDIKVSNLRVETHKPKVFVVMPFSEPYNELYEHVFEPVCRGCGLEIHRSDRTYGPGLIIADIAQRIMRSHVIIAEITPNPPNPNVYLEVGFSIARGKALIMIANKDCPENLPFDVSPFRVMFYENTIAGKADIEMELVNHLRAILPWYSPIDAYHQQVTNRI